MPLHSKIKKQPLLRLASVTPACGRVSNRGVLYTAAYQTKNRFLSEAVFVW